MTLDEDMPDEKRVKFTVSANDKDEMPKIRKLQEIFDHPSPGKVLKIAAFAYLNVIQGTLGEETFKYLISRERVRKSDYKRAKNTRI